MSVSFHRTPLEGTVKDISPVKIQMVRQSPQEPWWDHLVRQYHYLGHRRMPGANLKYLAFSGDVPVAALSFRAASLTLQPRDCFIGWSPGQRKQHLGKLANNNRYLILPWVKVKNLGSYLLAQVIRQLPEDWYCFYREELLLLETFVDPRYFKGTVYRATGWVHVGSTLGFTRQGASYTYHGHPKEVYLYPLEKDFRTRIGCRQRPYHRPLILTEKERKERYLMLLNRVDWDPNLAAHLNIDPDEVKVLSSKLLAFFQTFRDCFKREEHRSNALVYLKGLAGDLLAKSVEPIALYFQGQSKVRALQHFISGTTWDVDSLTQKNQEVLGPKISDENGMFTIDSSETPKKGKDSAGVYRQYCGNLGKVANCQSGVHLGYASEKGYGLLGHKLFVPEAWFTEEYAERRKKTRFPQGLGFKTKTQLAWELLEKAEAIGSFTGKWVGIDSFFGRDADFRDAIGEKYFYFAEIPCDTRVWLERPKVGLPPYKGRGPYPQKKRPLTDSMPVSQIARDPSLGWETMNLGEGAKGPLIAQVTRLRVVENREGFPGKDCWLFLRQDKDGKIKYAFSNAPKEMPLQELAWASTLRWTIEQLFQEGKTYLGMDDYEIRSYPGWHRHMALVALIMHFFLEVRLEFGEKKLYYAAPGAKVADCFHLSGPKDH